MKSNRRQITSLCSSLDVCVEIYRDGTVKVEMNEMPIDLNAVLDDVLAYASGEPILDQDVFRRKCVVVAIATRALCWHVEPPSGDESVHDKTSEALQ